MLGDWTEDKLLDWAKQKVKKEPTIANFKDKSIANCKFLFNLLETIEPRAINWSLIKEEETDEAMEQNAKYVISVARKLGAVVFLVWNDIKEVKPKMIMTFIGAIAHLVKQGP